MKKNTQIDEISNQYIIEHKEVINIGLELFVETLSKQGIKVIDVAFNPSLDRPSDITDLINKMMGE
ncbi:MAG: hypothetical protein Q8N39_06050 [Pelolinea sp.]|nr:hypothetical protein [Pelolinea sp.]